MLVDGKDSKLYEGKNNDYPTHPVCCRIYEEKVGIAPDAMYLKFLRHLGKKHSSIVGTWDIFSEDKKILIYQEYCLDGPLDKFAKENKDKMKDPLMALLAWQLIRGMDFLGDIGISHRDIQPKNLVLRPAGKNYLIKICNFRKAIVYWNITENDITFLPCLPVKDQSKGESYQAPEVFGNSNKEEFDPIVADTWSYGAVLYFMASQKYPYNVSKTGDNIEKEIQENVKKLPEIKDSGKELVGNILKTNAAERMPIGFIEKSAWFSQAKKVGCFRIEMDAAWSFYDVLFALD